MCACVCVRVGKRGSVMARQKMEIENEVERERRTYRRELLLSPVLLRRVEAQTMTSENRMRNLSLLWAEPWASVTRSYLTSSDSGRTN